MDEIEHAAMKQRRVRRVAFDRYEGPAVLDRKGFRIDHRDADPAAIGVEKRPGDPPIGFRAAEIENIGLAAFGEDTLDQPLDGGEPPGAKAEFQAVRIRIGILSGAGIFVRCVCARESTVHLIAPIIG